MRKKQNNKNTNHLFYEVHTIGLMKWISKTRKNIVQNKAQTNHFYYGKSLYDECASKLMNLMFVFVNDHFLGIPIKEKSSNPTL